MVVRVTNAVTPKYVLRFDNAEIAISDGELIVGRFNRPLTESEVKVRPANRYAIGAGSTHGAGIT